MQETEVTRPHMIIRKFKSHAEQEAEDIRYWNARTIDYKMQATIQLIESHYTLRGVDTRNEGSERSLVRLQRIPG